MKTLLNQLIAAAPTADNGELAAAEVLAGYFRQHGIDAETDGWDGCRANVTAGIGADDPAAPTLIFGAHLDVVPASRANWDTDPFEPVERDGCLYGRGSVDMLGGLCAAAASLVETARSGASLRGRVVFVAAAGEETDSCGVQRFVRDYAGRAADPVGVIIPEPTGLRILRAHRGILWLRVETAGKTAHGSMPHLGINAIEKMNALLNRLSGYAVPHRRHDLLGGCSMSINRIHGGSATNIVPEQCAVELDIRTLPGQSREMIIDSLKALCDELGYTDPDFHANISIIRAVDAMETPGESPFVQTVCAATGIAETHAAGFTTDGPYFAQLNAPVVIFGPGDGALCHQPNEHLELAQLDIARRHYQAVIARLFG